jgi:NTP pyrophosphatase (non-canonical NTP hydrolase)
MNYEWWVELETLHFKHYNFKHFTVRGKAMTTPDFATFAAYQRESRKTWSEIPMNHPIVYPTMGLTNETGELAGKIKKIFRDKQGVIGPEDREELKKELGDILWYFTQICTELDLTLEEVAEANIEKLFSRLERGKIGGDGDDR